LEGGPVGAVASGVNGSGQRRQRPGRLPNISSSTDPTLPLTQAMDQAYEMQNLLLQGEEMRHQVAMQEQSQQFNDVQDEKAEQMREINTLREVAMKQREADDKIVKEFIKTAGGE
jgi:arginine/lysine/ornithine decarboxylase